MSQIKFRVPQAPGNGGGTFSDNLVGFQLVDGGGLTQGNFEFTNSIVEKSDRHFSVGVFSKPISLDDLNIESSDKAKEVFANEYGIYPNYDISQISSFALYGSLTKRFSVSVQNIINYFPAAIEVNKLNYDFSSANTVYDILYDEEEDITEFSIDVSRIKNPFDIDYTTSSVRNIAAREFEVSRYRDLTTNFSFYSLYYNNDEYPVVEFTPSDATDSGVVTFTVSGRPFSGITATTDDIVIRLNTQTTEQVFAQLPDLDRYLLNRLITPKYTAIFKVPKETDTGKKYVGSEKLTWTLDGLWNIDIRTNNFDRYLNKLNRLTEEMDEFKTNLVSRFLTTGAFKDFDTEDQKVEKILQIYGRSFDETKRFIDALSYMTSVHYNLPNNDIPSKLLTNLAKTLGWEENISPITKKDLLASIFDTGSDQPLFSGYSRDYTPNEINFQFYRNLILNSAYLFKSKGTRKPIEFLMRFIGAPESLIQFNETVYLADGKININRFNEIWAGISGGTYLKSQVVFDGNNTFGINGTTFSGYTLENNIQFITNNRSNYPVDDEGYPKPITNNDFMYFEKGAGWYETTQSHRSLTEVDTARSVYTGNSPQNVTVLESFTYGQKYFDYFRSFPDINMGFGLRQVRDNKKSWTDEQLGKRRSFDGGFNAKYSVSDERLVLNAKNIELSLNVSQPLEYAVWKMSVEQNYPIPSEGLPSPPYPDVSNITPNPRNQTFFEFSQTFFNTLVNVRDRWYSSDGKTSGYPVLQSLYWKYLNSDNTVGIPSDKITYQKMINFTIEIGDYWMKLVEQMIPASTIWNGGVKYENSIFHRQKFVYRRQRGCQIVPVPCENCLLECNFFSSDCIDETVECSIYPWVNGGLINSFSSVLQDRLTACARNNNIAVSDINMNTLQTEWYVDIYFDNSQIKKEKFFDGFGNDTPTNAQWVTALEEVLPYLFNFDLNYAINGTNLTITNTGCRSNFGNQTFTLNVGINFTFSLN